MCRPTLKYFCQVNYEPKEFVMVSTVSIIFKAKAISFSLIVANRYFKDARMNTIIHSCLTDRSLPTNLICTLLL